MGMFQMALMVLACVIMAFIAIGTKKRPLHGKTEFQTKRQIKKLGLNGSEGIIVGKSDSGYLLMPGTEHVSLIAPTRSGKGVSVVMPNGFGYTDSMVILDRKEEIFKHTSKYREKSGQKVFKYNPFSTNTHQYNPLYYVSDDPSLMPVEVMNIAYILYPKASGNTDPMWSDNARDLFVGIALYLLETERKNATIPEIYRQSSGLGLPLEKHLQKVLDKGNFSEACTNSLQRFINTPDVTRGGILANFTAPLSVFSSPVVDAASSGNDFDLRRLRKDKMTIYICIPPNKISEGSILTKLFISQLINLNTDEVSQFSSKGKSKGWLGKLFNKKKQDAKKKEEDKPKHHCLLMLDEFPSLDYLKKLAEAPGYVAGYGLRLLLIAQSTGQVTKPVADGGYGREGAKEIFDNMGMNICFAPRDIEDAKKYSEFIGNDTVKSRSTQIKGIGTNGTQTDYARAKYLPQEMMDLDEKKCMMFMYKGNLKKIIADKINFYDDPTFVNRMKSVSPSLAKLGYRIPTEEELVNAWSSGELSSFVPTQDIELHKAKRQKRVRKITKDDIKNGLDAAKLEKDYSSLPKHEGVMNDAEVKSFAEMFVDLQKNKVNGNG